MSVSIVGPCIFLGLTSQNYDLAPTHTRQPATGGIELTYIIASEFDGISVTAFGEKFLGFMNIFRAQLLLLGIVTLIYITCIILHE